MIWITILLACLSGVRLNPTFCAEESHCPSGFYCEASAHVCRECLRCEDLKREPPAPPDDGCIKSVTECGQCFKGLLQVYEGPLSGQCIPEVPESPGGVLPSYAWAAIAVSVVLMIVMLCLFSRMKTFKFAYAARTSVQSLQTVPMAANACAPPPPYNNLDGGSPVAPQNQPEAFELQKLLESPSPPTPALGANEVRRRENSSSQYARVFCDPVYVGAPRNEARGSSPTPVSVGNDVRGDRSIPASPVGSIGSHAAAEPLTGASTITDDTTVTNNNSSDCGNSDGKINSLSRKTRVEREFQDSNNNFSKDDEGSEYHRRSSSAAYCTSVMTGPSFIINVVENINNATVTHAEFHT